MRGAASMLALGLMLVVAQAAKDDKKAFLFPGWLKSDKGAAKDSSESDMDAKVESLEDDRFKSNLKELGSYQKAAQIQAVASIDEAKLAEAKVEAIDLKEQVLLREAKNAIIKAKDLAASSAKSLERVKKAGEGITEYEKTAAKLTDEAAQKAVNNMFTRKFHELNEWRKQVLTDHYEEARRAELKAAAPYQYATNLANNKARAYEVAAASMSSLAKDLQTEGAAISRVAGKKRMGGDLHGATADTEVAKNMKAHGSEIGIYAANLKSQADLMAKVAPEYLLHGQMAAKRARFDANPEDMTPLEDNPSYAYLPPSSTGA
eukprot:TRINITY_DN108807_c0_g1_i1.p1 TRINITY_DN108807_c0_g1~~TRINITY_DN108807_c0_g1_i1.p1  ORF type:complete len:319 (-),score=107.34 TRINITY_DN108807_c0_g1_i1:71-1027(-)